MKEFFKDIPYVKYEGANSTNPMAFHFYNPDEVIAGKSMRDHMKFAMSYWHTMCAEGSDMFGVGTIDKSYGASDPMELAKDKAYAAFEFMNKLSIDYFCFHDRDIAPEGATLAESNARLDEISDLLAELMKKYDKKLLWGTANCFNNPRYMHGAGTSPNADVFAFAAAQIKKAMEITVKLGGNGYVYWGGREGYETLLNTDMGLELDNLGYLLQLTSSYARSIGFKGDFYIEPKPKEPTKHQYDFDAATVCGFLRKYGLDKDFRLNIEANHATLAGHTFQHELATARVNGAFGSIDANQGDMLLGWDTDQFPTNVYDTTFCMLEVLKAGGFTNGGLNFDAKARRGSNTWEDIAYSYIAGMDAFALGLRKAAAIIEDGTIDKFVADRYASYKDGIGKKIADKTTSIEELEAHALAMGDVSVSSGRQEYLENVMNRLMF
ncbi:MAG: xylose isomerase [Ruminococcaceae bacterium]|nr:xylose isomerase [Oscillospiraceae bacterium]